MGIVRRILGILVMIAGILGLLLSLVGLVVIWVAKPTVASYASSTLDTLSSSVVTSQDVMEVTGEALGATIASVDALSAMLGTTAVTVQDTQPVLDQIDTIMAVSLPSTLDATTQSLLTAQSAVQVMESAIQSLDAFRFVLSATPLVGGFVETPTESYSPDKPLADSLGEIAASLEGLPDTFIEMSENLSASSGNLVSVQENLVTMSDSVALISSSLSEYQSMVVQSQSSMDNVILILTSVQSNLETILNTIALVMTLFFLWLLAAQVVILSQGWELYQGTTDRMESSEE